MTDDTLRHRILEAVTGDPDPERDRQLRDDLAGQPGLLEEFERLSEAWRILGLLPASAPPESARKQAEQSVSRAIAGGGPIRPVNRMVRHTARIAAALLLFAAGAATGIAWARSTVTDTTTPALPSVAAPAAVPERPLFAFIIRGEPAQSERDLDLAMVGFARELWSEERLVWAERLSAEQSAWLDADGGSQSSLPPATRLLMVRATDREEALRLARRAPHLANGGVVEILGSAPTPGG